MLYEHTSILHDHVLYERISAMQPGNEAGHRCPGWANVASVARSCLVFVTCGGFHRTIKDIFDLYRAAQCRPSCGSACCVPSAV